MRRVSLIALAVLASASILAVQTNGQIEIRVTRQDGTPLPGVSVQTDAIGQVALTDADGHFALPEVPPGTTGGIPAGRMLRRERQRPTRLGKRLSGEEQ